MHAYIHTLASSGHSERYRHACMHTYMHACIHTYVGAIWAIRAVHAHACMHACMHTCRHLVAEGYSLIDKTVSCWIYYPLSKSCALGWCNSQVQIQSPGLTMGVSKEDPCASKGQHKVPPLSSGVSGSFYLPPQSLCELSGNAHELHGGRKLALGDLSAEPVEVTISLFQTNVYAALSEEQTGTPVASIKTRAFGEELRIQNVSGDLMKIEVGIAPSAVPSKGLAQSWVCAPSPPWPPSYPPLPSSPQSPSFPQLPAWPPSSPLVPPVACWNQPLPAAWGGATCSQFDPSVYCSYADFQSSCCVCGGGSLSVARRPPPSAPPSWPPRPLWPPVNESLCRLVHGAGDCSEFSFCSGRGNCTDGLCLCPPGFIDANCSVFLSCKYWDESISEWSSEGVESSPKDGKLVCSATHLTTFGGIISIPTSVQELLNELKAAVTFNTFSLDEAFSILSNFTLADNPTLMTAILTMVAVQLISIWWRAESHTHTHIYTYTHMLCGAVNQMVKGRGSYTRTYTYIRYAESSTR